MCCRQLSPNSLMRTPFPEEDWIDSVGRTVWIILRLIYHVTSCCDTVTPFTLLQKNGKFPWLHHEQFDDFVHLEIRTINTMLKIAACSSVSSFRSRFVHETSKYALICSIQNKQRCEKNIEVSFILRSTSCLDFFFADPSQRRSAQDIRDGRSSRGASSRTVDQKQGTAIQEQSRERETETGRQRSAGGRE